VRGVGSKVTRTDGLHDRRKRGIRWLRLLFQRRRRGCERSVVELHGIDRAINASAHDGRRRGIVVGARRADHVEVVVVLVLLHPLVVAWGLHGGIIRGGLIACWSGKMRCKRLAGS
jgi:hypothetical protein